MAFHHYLEKVGKLTPKGKIVGLNMKVYKGIQIDTDADRQIDSFILQFDLLSNVAYDSYHECYRSALENESSDDCDSFRDAAKAPHTFRKSDASIAAGRPDAYIKA